MGVKNVSNVLRSDDVVFSCPNAFGCLWLIVLDFNWEQVANLRDRDSCDSLHPALEVRAVQIIGCAVCRLRENGFLRSVCSLHEALAVFVYFNRAVTDHIVVFGESEVPHLTWVVNG